MKRKYLHLCILHLPIFTIQRLCLRFHTNQERITIFDRGYNDFSNLNTINRIGAFFVVRAKTNVRIKPKTWKRRLPEGVVSDVIGCFTVYKSSKEYPEELRKLIVENPEDGTRYIFLTNNLNASAELISSLYRNRWSVELFFKWIKQHLRIKKFWGTSEKRCTHTNLLCDNHLLPSSNSPTRYEIRTQHL